MIQLKFNAVQFNKEMNNIVNYSYGFVDGAVAAKTEFLQNLGSAVSEQASLYIDSNARVDQQSLHHVYEWYNAGNPTARLFDIKYSINNRGISFTSEFKQSTSIQQGSTSPFYDKARIMENGITVNIAPRKSDVLRFEVGGEVVYTKKPVTIENPGGNVQGQFENTFDTFFKVYFTQAFLRSSGLSEYFSNPIVYKTNLRNAAKNAKSVGRGVGYRWIANARVVA
jgi:hypothetical protein